MTIQMRGGTLGSSIKSSLFDGSSIFFLLADVKGIFILDFDNEFSFVISAKLSCRDLVGLYSSFSFSLRLLFAFCDAMFSLELSA